MEYTQGSTLPDNLISAFTVSDTDLGWAFEITNKVDWPG